MRREKDLLGELELSDDVYYGVQSERARKNFAVSKHTIDELPVFIHSVATIKKAAAIANHRIGALDERLMKAICAAADEIVAGKMIGHFPVDIFQGGGSTSTNMNVNEVIANRANEMLTGKCAAAPVHPNTHVNMGQSTNDVIPAAIGISCCAYCEELLESLRHFADILEKKVTQFKDIAKVSRTCLQDAVPITLGQEFSAYLSLVKRHIGIFKSMRDECLELPLGGTATGTGLGSFPGYIDAVYEELAAATGKPFVKKENLFDGLQNGDGYVRLSAALKGLAMGLGKMARDLRIMSSGPRTGFNEIVLPVVQPGSSIMPGKINPVMPELINQICYQICGNDTAIGMAVEGGELDLNVWEPVIIKNFTESFIILTNGIMLFADQCVVGIEANEEVCRKNAEATLANATVISAIFGYEQGTKIAKKAHESGKSVKIVAVEENVLTKEEAERLLDPLMLTDVKKSSEIIAMKQKE